MGDRPSLAKRSFDPRSQPALRFEPSMSAGRVPPHNLDAEAAVLSAVLLGGVVLARVQEILKAAHFYSDANGRVFEACEQLTLAGTPIDLVTVATWLGDRDRLAQIGGPSYLARLADATPAHAHVLAHATVVYDKWRLRQLIAVSQKVAAEGYGDFGTTVDEFIGGAAEALQPLQRSPVRLDMPKRLGDGMMAALEADWSRSQQGGSLIDIRTGFAKLDVKIAGLHRGDLMIVAARPGVGKSAMALDVVRKIVAPAPAELALFAEQPEFAAAVFSLEMPLVQLQSRMICSDAFVDLGRRRSGMLQGSEWQRCFDSATRLSTLPIWVDDTPGISPADIRAKLRHVVAAWEREGTSTGRPRRLGVVVVDYLQLMRFPGRTGEDEIAAISKSLKEIAKEFDVPVIALSQLNRAVETRNAKDKRPQMSDLRGSGSIEQDADVIVFIYRDELVNPKTTNARGIAEFLIAKQRNGPCGRVLVRFTGHCTRFDDLGNVDDPDEDTEEHDDA